MSASRTASLPHRHRLRAAWGRAIAPLLQLTRYHGVWGFGVNLLRNLPLRQKAWIVALGVGLALSLALADAARLRWQEWTAAQAALRGVAELRALGALRSAALAVNRAAELAGTGGGRGSLQAALADEALAHAAERAALAGLLAGKQQLESAHAALDARRAELLAHRDDAPAPAADGRPGPLLLASRRYADAVEPLHDAFMLHWSGSFGGDVPTSLLRAGLVSHAGDLQARLHRLLAQALAQQAGQAPQAQPRTLDDQLAELRAVLALVRPSFDHARALLADQAVALDAARQDIARGLDAVQRLADAKIAGDGSADAIGRAELQALSARALAGVDRLGAVGLLAVEQRLQDRVATLRRNAAVVGGTLVTCMLLTAYLLVCTYKVLAGGLNFLCHQVDELGRGNLGIRPNGHGQDEIGRALRVLSQSARQMASLFEAVTHGVAAVSHASRVVATGNAGLADRTGEIRSSIEGVSSSTQAFSGAMDSCNDAVDRAADHVRAMRAEGQRCRKAMASLGERMRTLQRKSREIEQVVAMVEAVAYQTRLLAINASVEAARAGAAGKGFAVVAQEVRALATRSQGASQRIRDIVGSSIGEIDAGHQMSERLGQALVRSDQEVEAASGVIGEMVGLVRASQSQSVEVLSIARGVSDAISDNARLVQQLSKASAELRDEGDTLKRSVQHFTFG